MPDQTSPHVSLIIPTYRREKPLVDCLECALGQEYQPLEILVIDQTETHDLETASFLDSNRNRIRVLRHAPPSAVTARNRGLTETKGEILIFIDDDTTFEPSFVSAHVAAHNRGADVVQGRVVEEGWGVSYRAQWMLPWIRVIGSNTYDKSSKTNTLTGCNFSLSHHTVDTVGEFDPLFTGVLIREDADYGARCHKAGLKMVFDADACVVHHCVSTGGVDANIKATARIFEPSVLRNELYFARKHFSSLVVWQYKKRIARRLRRTCEESGIEAPAPPQELLRRADKAAKELLRRHDENI